MRISKSYRHRARHVSRVRFFHDLFVLCRSHNQIISARWDLRSSSGRALLCRSFDFNMSPCLKQQTKKYKPNRWNIWLGSSIFCTASHTRVDLHVIQRTCPDNLTVFGPTSLSSVHGRRPVHVSTAHVRIQFSALHAFAFIFLQGICPSTSV
jgi:hypothetical protein